MAIISMPKLLLLLISLFVLMISSTGFAQEQSCCLPDGSCEMLTPQDCIDQGGDTLRSGLYCTDEIWACCVAEGVCEMMDKVCCIENGFTFHPGETCGDIVCDSCGMQNPGDFNNDGYVNSGDMVTLINWLYGSGPGPPIPANADPDGNCCADTNDAIYLRNYIYGGGPDPVECTCVDVEVCPDTCETQYPGDANNDGTIDIIDITFLIQWIYQAGPAPPVPSNADPDGNCCSDSSDIVYLTEYLFQAGPPPVECTCVDIEICDTCDEQYPGDVNNDGSIDAADISFLTSWIYHDGDIPPVISNADPNGDCCSDSSDIVYLADFLYVGGPPPVECTCLDIPICDSCEVQNPGDIDGNGAINVADMICLIELLEHGEPVPTRLANADVNGDCWVEYCDIDYLKNWIFFGGPDPVTCTCLDPEICDCNVADANSDGSINIGDAVFMISHIFKGGDPPEPYYICGGDANFDCSFNVGDAVAIVNHIFRGGPAPVCCHDWIDDTTGCGLPLR